MPKKAFELLKNLDIGPKLQGGDGAHGELGKPSYRDRMSTPCDGQYAALASRVSSPRKEEDLMFSASSNASLRPSRFPTV
jgi:hypothetical protein